MFFRNIIQGNKKDITKISNVLDAHYDISRYYLDGLCNDTKIRRNQLRLKFNDANITINFDGGDLAGYSVRRILLKLNFNLLIRKNVKIIRE